MKQPISKRINGIHKTTSLRNNIIQVMNVMDCTSTGMNMDYFQNRLNTFDAYPKQMLPDKYRLASAGLYYTGKSDTCQCFRCHVKLNAWERDDDPIKEQHKWSPNCEYIKMIGVPQQQSGYTFGSSAALGGFGTGPGANGNNFQTWRANDQLM